MFHMEQGFRADQQHESLPTGLDALDAVLLNRRIMVMK
jgi:hypothetical protein